MDVLRGALRAVLPALCIWLIIVCVFQAARSDGYRAGFNTCKTEMSERAQLAYRQGREAGAEERFDEIWNDAFIAGATQMLVLYEQGGASAMRTQLAVVKGER